MLKILGFNLVALILLITLNATGYISFDVAAFLIFIAVLGSLIYYDRKKVKLQGIIFVRRTQKGRDAIDRIAQRHKRFWGFIAVAGVVISIQAGLLVALYTFLHYSYIDTEVIAHWTAEAKRLGALENKSEVQIQEAIKMLTEFYTITC